MNPAEEIDDLLHSLTDALRAILTRAYENGRDAGKREAAELMSASLAGLMQNGPSSYISFSPPGQETKQEPPAPSQKVEEGTRAAPGSIRPAILGTLAGGGHLRPSAIAQLTGIKENTVRGTLRNLLAEKKVEKAEGLWFLPLQKSGEETPDAGASGEDQ